jgi:hypothetical protein
MSNCVLTDCQALISAITPCAYLTDVAQQTACFCSESVIVAYRQCYPCLASTGQSQVDGDTFAAACRSGSGGGNPFGNGGGYYPTVIPTTGTGGGGTGGNGGGKNNNNYNNSNTKTENKTGMYIGIGCGGAAVIVLVTAFFIVRSRRKAKKSSKSGGGIDAGPSQPPPPMQAVLQNQFDQVHQPVYTQPQDQQYQAQYYTSQPVATPGYYQGYVDPNQQQQGFYPAVSSPPVASQPAPSPTFNAADYQQQQQYLASHPVQGVYSPASGTLATYH